MEPAPIIKHTLAKGTEQYIKRELERGRDFSALLLKNTDWTEGRCTTYLPSNASQEMLSNPDSCTLNAGVDVYFYSYISELLKNNEELLFIAEDREREKSPSWLDSPQINTFSYNKSVYWLCRTHDAAAITEMIWAASGACVFTGALCVYQRDDLFPSVLSANIARLEKFSKQTHLIIVSAYDDVGYVMLETKAVQETAENVLNGNAPRSGWTNAEGSKTGLVKGFSNADKKESLSNVHDGGLGRHIDYRGPRGKKGWYYPGGKYVAKPSGVPIPEK